MSDVDMLKRANECDSMRHEDALRALVRELAAALKSADERIAGLLESERLLSDRGNSLAARCQDLETALRHFADLDAFGPEADIARAALESKP